MHASRSSSAYSRLTAFCLSAVLLGLSACASVAPAPLATPGPALPVLRIQTTCADCPVSPEAFKAIEQGYRERAAANQRGTDATRHVRLSIVGYSERQTITRFAGPLAPLWSDSITAVLVVDGKRVVLSESARVPFQNIETLARRIGARAADSLSQ